jgi:hypothetical protein
MDVHTVALPKRMVGIGLGVTLCWCRRQGLALLAQAALPNCVFAEARLVYSFCRKPAPRSQLGFLICRICGKSTALGRTLAVRSVKTCEGMELV